MIAPPVVLGLLDGEVVVDTDSRTLIDVVLVTVDIPDTVFMTDCDLNAEVDTVKLGTALPVGTLFVGLLLAVMNGEVVRKRIVTDIILVEEIVEDIEGERDEEVVDDTDRDKTDVSVALIVIVPPLSPVCEGVLLTLNEKEVLEEVDDDGFNVATDDSLEVCVKDITLVRDTKGDRVLVEMLVAVILSEGNGDTVLDCDDVLESIGEIDNICE